eukprot:4129837-Alexandrium_andersonii.AAC.1
MPSLAGTRLRSLGRPFRVLASNPCPGVCFARSRVSGTPDELWPERPGLSESASQGHLHAHMSQQGAICPPTKFT